MVLADRYYSSYWLLAKLMKKGVDAVFQNHVLRKSDFRRGIQLGVRDHIIIWKKPKQRPKWMNKTTYEKIPDELKLREVKVKGKALITTFLNPKEVSKNELGVLYIKRWLIEIDFRAIKTTMQMDILRCKTPEMAEKEIAVHLLGYNLIRTVMAETASQWRISPRDISFKAAIQILNAFRERGLFNSKSKMKEILKELFKAIARNRVNDRPGRVEPRVIKRRPKGYSLMMKPRQILKDKLLVAATIYSLN